MTRVGLVLGGGGVVGQAYHSGVLAVLEHDFGFDARKVEVIVGTSAGSITGTVADSSGQMVPKATVKLTSELNGESRTTQTSETGDFFFGAIAPGSR